MTHTTITGIGSYLPPRVLTNADLESMVDTSDEWILSRTGISELARENGKPFPRGRKIYHGSSLQS